MNTGDIMKWIMPKFPVGKSFYGGGKSYKKEIVELGLICTYFQKFFAEDIVLEFPDMDYYQVCGGEFYDTESLSSIISNYEEGIKKSLYEELLKWSSFERIQIDFSDVSGIPFDARTWNSERKKAFIEKKVLCLKNDAQKQMYKIMPGPILDCLDMQSERGVIYLLSEKLAKYLKFSKQQKNFVKYYFFQEHRKLVKMLSYLKDPIENDMARAYISMKKKYILGYCVGRKDYQTTISYRSYNWTFFMAWYVLEKILQKAEELF